MESYEKEQPVAFGGQYRSAMPVRLRRASSASRDKSGWKSGKTRPWSFVQEHEPVLRKESRKRRSSAFDLKSPLERGGSMFLLTGCVFLRAGRASRVRDRGENSRSLMSEASSRQCSFSPLSTLHSPPIFCPRSGTGATQSYWHRVAILAAEGDWQLLT